MSTEAPQATQTPAVESSGSTASEVGVNWNELSGDDYNDVPLDGKLEVPVEAPALPVSSEPPVVAPPATPEPAVQAPTTVEPAKPAPAAAPTVPEVPAPAPLTLEQIQAQLTEQYALSPDDALAFQTAPETVLPKLAANMHVQIMREAYGQMQQMMQAVPALIKQHLESEQQERSAEERVFGEWPGLKEHKAVMLKNVILARQAQGPQATAEQVLEAAGVLTAMSLGLDPMTVRKTQQAQQTHQAPTVQGIPPRPAGAGTSGGGTPPVQQTVWDQLLEPDE